MKILCKQERFMAVFTALYIVPSFYVVPSIGGLLVYMYMYTYIT